MNINKMMIVSCLFLLGLEQVTLAKKESSQVKKQKSTQSKSKMTSKQGNQLVESFIEEINKLSVDKAQVEKAYKAYESFINYGRKNKKMVISKSLQMKLKKAIGKLPNYMILGDVPIYKSALTPKVARK